MKKLFTLTKVSALCFFILLSSNCFSQKITPIKVSWDEIFAKEQLSKQNGLITPINIKDGSGIDEDITQISKPMPIPNNANISRLLINSTARQNPTTVLSPTPSGTCNAVNDPQFDDNFGSIPPDTHGGVGPNHLVMTSNGYVRIQDKTNCATSTGCTGGCKVKLNSFFASATGLGGTAPSCFDPRVLYDKASDRYFVLTDANSTSNPNSGFILAVSTTNNPTGSWNFYTINDGDASNWFDYGYLSFNQDKVVITGNIFSTAGAFQYAKIFIFPKATLSSGGAITIGTNAQMIDLANTQGGSLCPVVDYDNSTGTVYVVQNWNPNSGGFGYIRFSTVTGNIPSCVFTGGVSFPSTSPWVNSGGANYAQQSGSANLIATGDSRIINSMKINNKIYAAQNSFIPTGTPTRSAPQWWELTTAGAVTQVSRIDGGANNYKYFPSIAADSSGNILVGYSVSTSSTFASAAFSFKSGADAINTMQAEYVFKTGNAKYFNDFSGGTNRWGDYSSTILDPVKIAGGNVIYTVQEYADLPTTAASPWGAGIDVYNTQWAKVNTVDLIALPVNLLDFNVSLQKNAEVLLSFSVESESNITNYELEKSKDGINFELVQIIAAKNISGNQTYSYIDKNPFFGISYYRLKINERNNRSIISTTKKINIIKPKPILLSLSPNPAKNNVNLKWYSPSNSKLTISIHNNLGALVFKETQQISEGYYSYNINVDQYANGNYSVVLKNNEWSQTTKFVKIK